MKAGLRRFCAAGLGAFFALTFLEILLYAWGLISLRAPTRAAEGEKGFTVLCLGDSFTYGMGAPQGQSYPEQLEALLRSRPGPRPRLLNHGIPAANTRTILYSLEQTLDRTHPDCVLLLAGWPNRWNFFGFGDYLRGTVSPAAPMNILSRLRTVKLFSHLGHALSERRADLADRPGPQAPAVNADTRGFQALMRKDFAAARDFFLEQIRTDPANEAHYLNLAVSCSGLGELDRAKAAVRRALRDFPRKWQFYHLLYLIHRQQHSPDTVSTALEAAVLFPEEDQVFSDLLEWARRTDDRTEKQRVLERIRQIPGARARECAQSLSYMLETPRFEETLREWVRGDLEKILLVCRRRSVPVVLQTYPPREPGQNDAVNAVIRAAAGETPLADHFAVFSGRPEQQNLLAPDGHPNAQGYALMAKTLAQVLDEENLLPKAEKR